MLEDITVFLGSMNGTKKAALSTGPITTLLIAMKVAS